MSVYVLCVNSIMFILSICSIPLTLCFVFVFILFSVLPYGEIKLCINRIIFCSQYLQGFLNSFGVGGKFKKVNFVSGPASQHATWQQNAFTYRNKTLSCRREAERCFMFVCSQLQHSYSAVFLLLVTAALDLLVHKILLNSVLLSPIVSGGVRPPPRTNTPRS